MKLLQTLFSAMLLVPSVSALAADSVASLAKPNIIVILADDLGQRNLGCYGSTFYETPNQAGRMESQYQNASVTLRRSTCARQADACQGQWSIRSPLTQRKKVTSMDRMHTIEFRILSNLDFWVEPQALAAFLVAIHPIAASACGSG